MAAYRDGWRGHCLHGKVEVGQNIRTSLTQAVADELHVPPSCIRLVMGDTDRTPFDMGTFGSMTTPYMAAHLRRIAAATREVLIGRAAARWGVDGGDLVASQGRVTHGTTDRSFTYGDLA